MGASPRRFESCPLRQEQSMKESSKIFSKGILIYFFIVIAAILGVGGYMYRDLHTKYLTLGSEKTALEEALNIKGEAIAQLEKERADLQSELDGEKQKIEDFGEQFGEIQETVEELDKLSKIDPELLQKYSKVFFLNEHYVPQDLTAVDAEYKWGESNDIKIHSSVWPYLENMLSDAKDDEVNIYALSGYRSFATQAVVKSRHKTLYGSGANQFSADQGYSEHQLGTTLDLTTEGIGAALDGFEKTSAYVWLQENAYKYGFVLSYPEGNAYYIFEPWHWRFVGEKLARALHREEKHFYDLDQREIDGYLIDIFD